VALAVSPDGRHAATAARDRKIRVHALPSGAVLRELAWHEAGLAFLGWGTGPTLISGDNDGNLAIWSSEALGR
jgi:WD40 repeat protein